MILPETEYSLEQRPNSILEGILGDTPEPAPTPEPEPEPEPESDEVDYDVDTTPAPEPVKRESKAAERAKIEGRRAKELEAKLTERELEFERVSQERETLAQELEAFKTTNVDPMSHPDFVSLKNEILSDVKSAAELMPIDRPNYLTDNFGSFMTAYQNLPEDGSERSEGLSALKGSIVDKLQLSEVPYAELEPDERRAYETTALEVLKIIQRNAGKTRNLQDLAQSLTEKSKVGLLSVGSKAYEAAAKEFEDALSAIGDLPDEVIEENPYAIESVVAKMAKESPQFAKVLATAKKDVMEMSIGPRVLTQAEIDKMQANGTDIKKFNAERAKLHKAKQLKLAGMAAQGLATRALLAKVLKENAELRLNKESEASEFDVISQSMKKKAPAKAPEPDYVPPSKRPLAIEKYLN